MRRFITALMVLGLCACSSGEIPELTTPPGNNEPEQMEPDQKEPDQMEPDVIELGLGEPCEESTDCSTFVADACFHLVSESAPGICTVANCIDTGCPEGSTCLDLTAAFDTSVCIKSPGFCEDSCGAPLECALKLECIEGGCCGDGPCPSACFGLSKSDCEMNALCSAECCAANEET